jgi:hypothetical protein
VVIKYKYFNLKKKIFIFLCVSVKRGVFKTTRTWFCAASGYSRLAAYKKPLFKIGLTINQSCKTIRMNYTTSKNGHGIGKTDGLNLSDLANLETPFGSTSENCPHPEKWTGIVSAVITNGQLDALIIQLDGDSKRSLILILVADNDGNEFRIGVSKEQAVYLVGLAAANADVKMPIQIAGYDQKETGERIKTASLSGAFARKASKAGKTVKDDKKDVPSDELTSVGSTEQGENDLKNDDGKDA